ncbi:MAG: homocysteine S-methyltransferase family protein [Parcubacteria group bacterium]
MVIKELLNNKFILFDGAIGTLLQQRGIIDNELPPLINISDREKIKKIHLEYLEAGSDVVITNTFSINSKKLGSKELLKDVINNATIAAREAVDEFGKGYVAYDIGPIGQLLEPNGTMKFNDAYNLFTEQIKYLDNTKIDLIYIETFTDLLELKAAILAVKENSDLPIFATMSFDDNQRTFSGNTPETLAVTLEGLGVDALGVNCSSGPEGLVEIVKRIEKISSTPVIAKPNAGIPTLIGNKTVFTLSPVDFANQMVSILKEKASIVGGCCGTTPEHIKELKAKLDSLTFEPINEKKITTTSSGVKTVVFDDFVKIGERINPTGKKMLKRAINSNNIDYIVSEAITQVEEGSDVLDINLSVTGRDEVDIFKKVIKPIQAVVDAPLQIDSTDNIVFEEILREYNGKAIINSVNGKKSSLENILPIAKKYGALIIGLTLDENGLPNNALERVSIAKRIIDTAQNYGIDKKNIIIDCLTLTASAQPEQVYETLKAIKMIKEELGAKTVLGASNISFGLPNRELINAVFLIKAREYGLDSAIINTGDKLLNETILADNVLRNVDIGASKYIEKITFAKNEMKDHKLNVSLDQAIIKGLGDTAKKLTLEILKEEKPLDVVDKYLLPALNKVGLLYETGAIFLPQLIQSAQAAKGSFHIINSKLAKDIDKSGKKIILATVEGDIHDIGKNIVKILLENYGFEVIDLGKDVTVNEIIKAVEINKVKLIGLSALMTTSVLNMKKAIKELKEKFPDIYIMVGGAVLTEKYSLEINADFYAKDAQEGVRIAKKVFN